MENIDKDGREFEETTNTTTEEVVQQGPLGRFFTGLKNSKLVKFGAFVGILGTGGYYIVKSITDEDSTTDVEDVIDNVVAAARALI